MKKGTTLYKIPMAEKLTPQDRHFVVLVVAGYPSNLAYMLAYDTKANTNTSAAMASRKLAQWEIQQLLSLMRLSWRSGTLEFPERLMI